MLHNTNFLVVLEQHKRSISRYNKISYITDDYQPLNAFVFIHCSHKCIYYSPIYTQLHLKNVYVHSEVEFFGASLAIYERRRRSTFFEAKIIRSNNYVGVHVLDVFFFIKCYYQLVLHPYLGQKRHTSKRESSK